MIGLKVMLFLLKRLLAVDMMIIGILRADTECVKVQELAKRVKQRHLI